MEEKLITELRVGEKFMLTGTGDFRVWVCDFITVEPTGDLTVYGSRIKGDGNVTYAGFTFASTARVVVID